MISVVIAAYKGEKYIAEQINSILPQLGDGDEIIISDDYPQGETRRAVEALRSDDNRIKYIEGLRKGVVRNFENAINYATGDYIFLADQDDVWLEGKVAAVMKEFNGGADVVLHNAVITDALLNPTGKTTFEINRTKKGIIRNIVKNSYQGSCMAFRASMKKFILPFPEKIPMHDQWIGLVGEKHGEVRLINRPYILYRRHDSNVSGNGSSAVQKLKWRMNILGCLLRK
jgi:glycosyltransferase involved in cell wall biosynthesis